MSNTPKSNDGPENKQTLEFMLEPTEQIQALDPAPQVLARSTASLAAQLDCAIEQIKWLLAAHSKQLIGHTVAIKILLIRMVNQASTVAIDSLTDKTALNMAIAKLLLDVKCCLNNLRAIAVLEPVLQQVDDNIDQAGIAHPANSHEDEELSPPSYKP